MFFNIKKKKTIGLALSGGGCRGIAHIGVLKTLQKYHIPIDFIAGTSVGSLIGGVYSANLDIELLMRNASSAEWKKFFDFSFSTHGVVSSRGLDKLLKASLGDMQFKDLKIPFSSVATHLLTGNVAVFNNPNELLSPAIQASMAFPGIVVPVKIGAHYYMDGALKNNLPISVVKGMGADYVIAVDVIPRTTLTNPPSNLMLIADRAVDIILKQQSQQNYNQADIVLEPILEQISSFDIHLATDLIKLGEIVTENQISAILQLV